MIAIAQRIPAKHPTIGVISPLLLWLSKRAFCLSKASQKINKLAESRATVPLVAKIMPEWQEEQRN